MAYQEQVSQIDSKISALESRKAAAENLGFSDNAEVLQREIDVLQEQRNQTQTQLSAQNSAAGQTAETKVVNDQPPAVSGAGQGNNSTTPAAATTTESLSDSEIKNIDNANKGGGAAAGGTDQDTSNNSNKSESGSDQIAGPDTKIDVGTDNNATATPAAASVPASLYYNRLHNFTGYTYKITLWLLTTEDYQKITADPDKFTPTHLFLRFRKDFLNR